MDLEQGATGVDISYAYVYLFSEWMTPGEMLFLSYRKLPIYYVKTSVQIGYSFYSIDPSAQPYIIKDITGLKLRNLST